MKIDKIVKNGNYYIAYSFENGKTMLRLSEKENSKLVPEEPELVDIKLTDSCNNGCPWCYQASTTAGRHGDTNLILDLLDNLNPDITEIAFGGGDILEHPDIELILMNSKQKGFITNITINYKSFLQKEKVETFYKALPYVDGIGISISNVKELYYFIIKHKEVLKSRPVSFHIIPDIFLLGGFEETLNLVEEHNFDILLLGYKEMGFAEPVKKNSLNIRYILEVLKRYKIPAQVDTKLLNDYFNIIEKYSAPLYYDIEEGEFSMNIDCVDNFYSIASYNLKFKGDIKDIIEKGVQHAFSAMRGSR